MASAENIFPRPLLAAARAAAGAELAASLVDIAAVCRAADHEEILARLFSVEERERLSSFRMAKRRREWLAGRVSAKMTAREFLRLPGEGVIVVDNLPDGSPCLVLDGRRLAVPRLSIAHSGTFAAAVATDRHCGIDVQEETDTLVRVVDRFCTKAEESLLAKVFPELPPVGRLNLLWSCKEAIRKAWNHDHIPGFLRLACREITPLAEVSLFHFLLEDQWHVPVHCCTLDDYALALCIPDGERHA